MKRTQNARRSLSYCARKLSSSSCALKDAHTGMPAPAPTSRNAVGICPKHMVSVPSVSGFTALPVT